MYSQKIIEKRIDRCGKIGDGINRRGSNIKIKNRQKLTLISDSQGRKIASDITIKANNTTKVFFSLFLQLL